MFKVGQKVQVKVYDKIVNGTIAKEVGFELYNVKVVVNNTVSYVLCDATEIITSNKMSSKKQTKLVANVFTIFNNKTTVVENNGYKAVATCSEDDHFDPVVGFCVAFTAATLFKGSKKAMKSSIMRAYKKQIKK